MRRAALLFLVIASPAVAAGLLVAHPFGEASLAVAAALFPAALIALAIGRERLGGLGLALAGLALLLLASFVAMLLLRGRVLTAPWIGGLPLAAASQIYGVVVGLVLIVAAYALTFERFGIDEEDLERFRGEHSRRREAPPR